MALIQFRNRHGKAWQIALALGVMVYFVSPLLAWVAVGYLLSRASSTRLAIIWTYLAFVPIATAIHQSKYVESDWQWYVEQFESYPDYNLPSIFGNSFLPSNQAEEPIYYFFSWIISIVSGENLNVLVLFIVVVGYGAISWGVHNISRSLSLDSFDTLSLVYLSFGVGMIFTFPTHLVRQAIASALLLLAFSFFLQRKTRNGLLASLVAVGTHSSSVIVAVFLFIFHKFPSSSRPQRVLLYFLLGFAFGWLMWILYLHQYSGRSDGAPNLGFVAFEILLFIALQAVFSRKQETGQLKIFFTYLLSVVSAMFGFVAGIIHEPLPALRFYLYLSPFIGTALWFLIFLCRRIFSNALTSQRTMLISGLLSIGSMNMRLTLGDFRFELGFMDFLWAF